VAVDLDTGRRHGPEAHQQQHRGPNVSSEALVVELRAFLLKGGG
jgi:hypothetical protein